MSFAARTGLSFQSTLFQKVNKGTILSLSPILFISTSSKLSLVMRPFSLLPQQTSRPSSPSFFNGKRSPYLDFVHDLEERLHRLKRLQEQEKGSSSVNTEVDPSVIYPTWVLQKDMETKLQCTMKTIHYRRITQLLNQIWVQPNSEKEKELIDNFRRSLTTHQKKEKVILPDKWGRYKAQGHRKTAQASVWLSEGTGEILINGKKLDEYFQRTTDKDKVIQPLVLANVTHSKNIFAIVRGSGHTGQSEAIRLAVSRALASNVPEQKMPLKKAGLLKRDTRIVERKKYGQRKARRKFQWVKR